MIPHGRIRGALRQIWWKFDEARKDVVRDARTGRGQYLCEGCKECFPRQEIEIDHRTPCGPTPGSRNGKEATWDGFLERLFVPVEGLQVLCLRCHALKTKAKAKGVLHELR